MTTEVRREPDGRRVAIKTSEKISVGPWFVFDPDMGGHYTDGLREGVARLA